MLFFDLLLPETTLNNKFINTINVLFTYIHIKAFVRAKLCDVMICLVAQPTGDSIINQSRNQPNCVSHRIYGMLYLMFLVHFEHVTMFSRCITLCCVFFFFVRAIIS